MFCMMSIKEFRSRDSAGYYRGSDMAWSIPTPADADEHPLAELVGGVGEHDGGVEVAALAKHPEEVGGVEIIKGGCDKPTPSLQNDTLAYLICE